ncbi:hypothetical protein PTKIN_Ptkin11bG0067200 [Pterospermum kingtungense]
MYIQDHFKAQPTYILLCSSMKTGSAWLKALSFSIVTRTQFNSCTSPLKTTFTHHCIPFLEYGLYPIQLQLLDTFVSMRYFLKKTTQNFLQDQLNEGDNNPIITSMEDAFELFRKGISVYGPYWEHFLGYWKASLEHPEKILFLKYEDMMKNPESYAKRLAEFLGCLFFLGRRKRKGKIGDCRNYLTTEMGERLDSLMEQKLSGSGPTFRDI